MMRAVGKSYGRKYFRVPHYILRVIWITMDMVIDMNRRLSFMERRGGLPMLL